MAKLKICPTCGASYDAAHLFCSRDSAPLRPAEDSGELVGSLVAGRYLISARIGGGGMGEVYRAQDVRLQRPVAIKVLHASLSGDVDALARFSREAANCSKINNPYVVQVYDFGESEDGLAYLAMELVQGRSLRTLLDAEAPLAPDRVVRFVAQMANGLDAAHRLDCPVVHRDLKPENVLVAQNFEGAEIVKVADFGISKAMRDDAQQVTRTGFVTGTYEFMSPEQVTGGAVDQRSDVYTLGLIAFLMLTGKLPFPGQTPEHSMLLRLHEAPRTLREMRPDLHWSDAVQGVMNKALARDPAGRYDSAGAFAKDLARSLQREQLETRARPKKRRAAAWTGIVVGLLVLAVGLVALLVRLRAPRDTAFARAPGDSLISLAEPVGSDTSARRDSSATAEATQPSRQAEPLTEPKVDTVNQSVTAAPREPVMRAPVRKRAELPKPQLPPSALPDRSLERANAMLQQYEDILHPGLERDSALRALASLNALIPRLRSARDSVEADLYRAEATALAGEPDEACAILDRARPRATELQRRKIELWVDQGICTAQQSSVLPLRSRNVTVESLRRIRTISNG
jgi:serine/threonine protein kinase